MSLTKERINEIALECGLKHLDIIHDGSIQAFANEFLSRIREEQEPAGYKSLSGECASNLAGMILARIEGPFTPLFTIPPAAPDCKELVEALRFAQKKLLESAYPYDEAAHRISESLAKHKASMGEE